MSRRPDPRKQIGTNEIHHQEPGALTLTQKGSQDVLLDEIDNSAGHDAALEVVIVHVGAIEVAVWADLVRGIRVPFDGQSYHDGVQIGLFLKWLQMSHCRTDETDVDEGDFGQSIEPSADEDGRDAEDWLEGHVHHHPVDVGFASCGHVLQMRFQLPIPLGWTLPLCHRDRSAQVRELCLHVWRDKAIGQAALCLGSLEFVEAFELGRHGGRTIGFSRLR